MPLATTLCTTAAAVCVALLAAPSSAGASNLVAKVDASNSAAVHFGFTAKYSAVTANIDDFEKQLRVMMARTEAVGKDDIVGVDITETTTGQIGCVATLATTDHATALTTAIENKHLSVYVDRIGYIAVILGDGPMNPTNPTNPTDPTYPITSTTTPGSSTSNVTVMFNASVSEVDLGVFAAEVNTSLIVSAIVLAGDVVRVDLLPYGEALYATVLVSTPQAAAAIQIATVGGKFRVAIGSKTYKARLSALPGITTSQASTVTTVPPRSTEHPTTHGYVWLNEYTADSENINDCSTGHDWSGIVVSKMPVGCHRFVHEATRQDEFNMLALDPDSGNVTRFGMICDIGCTSCISNAQDEMAYSECQETWGGSVSINAHDDHCLGATYLDNTEGTVSVFQYSSASCNFDEDLSTSLYVRNYPAPIEGDESCTADGTTGTFYTLQITGGDDGEVTFSGKMGCSDSACSEDCTAVDNWREGACQSSAAGKGMSIWLAKNALKDCSGSNDHIEEAQSKTSSVVQQMMIADYKPKETGNVQTETKLSDGNLTTASVGVRDSETPTSLVVEAEVREPSSDASADVIINEQHSPEDLSGSSMTLKQSQVTRNSIDGANFNKTVEALMISGATGLGLALVIIGVLYKRSRKPVRAVAPDEDDIMRGFRQYAESNGYSEYHDDRLITDI